MKAIIPALIIFGVVVVIFAVSTRRPTERRLSRPERRELESLRNLRDDLQDQAAQHTALGDNFAVIVMDTIRAQKRENR